jgi:hypothetical protein
MPRVSGSVTVAGGAERHVEALRCLELDPVHRPAADRLTLGLVRTVVGVRDAYAGAERLDQPWHLRQFGDQRQHGTGDAV